MSKRIKLKAKSAVRIIELPTCKMVWSGIEPSENEKLHQFSEWWAPQDALRADRFYGRDFMWHDTDKNGFAWGYAVTEVPADTGGYEVIDFPGGLFAVATYAIEGEYIKDAENIYYAIKKWVEKSGCFAVDEGAGRYVMWNSVPKSKEACDAMAAAGYYQFDQYVPVRIKAADEK